MLFNCTVCNNPVEEWYYVTVNFKGILVKKGPICKLHIQKYVWRDTVIAESLVPEGFGEDEETEAIVDET